MRLEDAARWLHFCLSGLSHFIQSALRRHQAATDMSIIFYYYYHYYVPWCIDCTEQQRAVATANRVVVIFLLKYCEYDRTADSVVSTAMATFFQLKITELQRCVMCAIRSIYFRFFFPAIALSNGWEQRNLIRNLPKMTLFAPWYTFRCNERVNERSLQGKWIGKTIEAHFRSAVSLCAFVDGCWNAIA